MADNEVAEAEQRFNGRELRDALGQFCTGITVITAVNDGAPVGFACQSFCALSIEPPLVLFCVMKTSGSWKGIEAAGRFAVNVLGEEQQDVCSTFGRRGEDKFAAVDWTPSPLGSPVIDGVMAWFDCTIDRVLDGGDHWVVYGRVGDLGPTDRTDRPLLFYRGAYLRLEEDVVDPTPEMEELENFITSSGPYTWL